MVPPPSRTRLEEMAVAEGRRELSVVPPSRIPRPPSVTEGQDHSPIRSRERTSSMKNRMREFCTSGSVRGGDGNIPTYSAGGLGDRSRTTVCFIEPVEARIGIRLENPRVAVQMTLRVIAGPIARIEKHRCRRIPPPERAIIANIGPQPTRHRLPLGQHRHRGVVAMDAAAGENVSADKIVDRV